MLKIALAAQSELTDPATVLHNLNTLFCGRLKRQFFTAAYAVIDTARGSMTVASGGHPPVLVLESGASAAVEIDARGFVVGRMRSASFTPATHGFAHGDLAVLYTDGIVEALNRAGEGWDTSGWGNAWRHIEQHPPAKSRALSSKR